MFLSEGPDETHITVPDHLVDVCLSHDVCGLKYSGTINKTIYALLVEVVQPGDVDSLCPRHMPHRRVASCYEDATSRLVVFHDPDLRRSAKDDLPEVKCRQSFLSKALVNGDDFSFCSGFRHT